MGLGLGLGLGLAKPNPNLSISAISPISACEIASCEAPRCGWGGEGRGDGGAAEAEGLRTLRTRLSRCTHAVST